MNRARALLPQRCCALLLVWLAGVELAAQETSAPLPALPTSEFTLNTLRPSSTNQDGMAVELGSVLEPLSFDLRVMLQFDKDPLTRQQETEAGYEQTEDVVTRQLSLHVNAALGLFPFTQLAVQLPLYLNTGLPGEQGAPGDLAFVPKAAYRFDLARRPEALGLALLVRLTVPTGRTRTLSGAGLVTASPVLAADLRLGSFVAALDLGALLRQPDSGVPQRGSALLAGALVGYDILIKSAAIRPFLEATVHANTADIGSRGAVAVVGHGGARYTHAIGLCLGAALGVGLSPGIGVPDVRLLVSAGWTLPSFRKTYETALLPDDSASTDKDLDGLKDPSDRCPAVPEDFDGFSDEDGCPEPDNDADGIPDHTDKCPNEAENLNGLADSDGCPEQDKDEDRVTDEKDRCPEATEDLDEFEDDDGCPEHDNDLDGVVDAQDNCPRLPLEVGMDSRDGCPRTYALEGDLLVPRRPLRFEKGTARLVEPGYDVLEQLGIAIIVNPTWRLRIEVHGTGAGKTKAALELSVERAATLRRLLIATGVIAERVEAVGRGNEAPIAPADSKDGRRLNERIVIQIIAPTGAAPGGTP